MKILLIDDHALFSEGMQHVLSSLETDVTILNACRCEEGFTLASKHPDLSIVLQDLNVPDMDGCAAVRKYSAEYASLPVVVLTASENVHDMRRAFDAGAAGYICKTSSGDIMLSALRLVLTGGIYVPPILAGIQPLHEAPTANKQPLSNPNLTIRQHQVLMLLRDGRSNKDIARHMGLADATIKSHITAILQKFGVQSRTEAALCAKELFPE